MGMIAMSFSTWLGDDMVDGSGITGMAFVWQRRAGA